MQRKLYCFAEDWRLICNICGGGDFWRRLVNYRTKDVNVPDAVHRLVDFTTPVHRVRGAGTEFAGSAVSRSGAPPITKKSNGSVTFATRSRELILCYTSSLLFFFFFFGQTTSFWSSEISTFWEVIFRPLLILLLVCNFWGKF